MYSETKELQFEPIELPPTFFKGHKTRFSNSFVRNVNISA